MPGAAREVARAEADAAAARQELERARSGAGGEIDRLRDELRHTRRGAERAAEAVRQEARDQVAAAERQLGRVRDDTAHERDQLQQSARRRSLPGQHRNV